MGSHQNQGVVRHPSRKVDDIDLDPIDSLAYLYSGLSFSEVKTSYRFLRLFKRHQTLRVLAPLVVHTVIEATQTGMGQSIVAKTWEDYLECQVVIKNTEEYSGIELPVTTVLLPPLDSVTTLWIGFHRVLIVEALDQRGLETVWQVIAKKSVAEEY